MATAVIQSVNQATGCDSGTPGASTRGTIVDVSRVSWEGNGAFQALGRGRGGVVSCLRDRSSSHARGGVSASDLGDSAGLLVENAV